VAVRERSAAALILLSTAAIGLAYLGMAGAQSLFFACLLSVLGGTGNGIQWVSVMTALQEATPQDYQARVVGLLESALAAMPGVGYLIGGVLTAVGSPRTAYAVAGAGTLLLVLVALVALRGLRLDHLSRRSSDHHQPVAPDLHRPPDTREVSLETGER
jgi:MFS family permease